jgi:hypothetical protein
LCSAAHSRRLCPGGSCPWRRRPLCNQIYTAAPVAPSDRPRRGLRGMTSSHRQAHSCHQQHRQKLRQCRGVQDTAVADDDWEPPRGARRRSSGTSSSDVRRRRSARPSRRSAVGRYARDTRGSLAGLIRSWFVRWIGRCFCLEVVASGHAQNKQIKNASSKRSTHAAPSQRRESRIEDNKVDYSRYKC